ncbi:hypothetical protein VTK73DRAFT_4437 [Phialemonium thermophilum]|uniref:Uncharacterized protein n=1 Tax=Phialemonium thermophilum TaxID=223376 RepID=A0ABR3WTU3_9PEZI
MSCPELVPETLPGWFSSTTVPAGMCVSIAVSIGSNISHRPICSSLVISTAVSFVWKRNFSSPEGSVQGSHRDTLCAPRTATAAVPRPSRWIECRDKAGPVRHGKQDDGRVWLPLQVAARPGAVGLVGPEDAVELDEMVGAEAEAPCSASSMA